MTTPDRAESAAATLRARISAGQVRPGQGLSEQALSQELEISRNTLREAFRILMHEGLLHREPNRGVFVVDVTTDLILDVYRARQLMEPAIVESSMRGHPAINEITGAVDRAEAAMAAGDWAEVGTANMDFHRALVALSDSPRMRQFFARLTAELRLIFLAIDDADRVHAPFVSLNREIADLLVAGEAERAARRLEDYLERSARTMLGAFSRGGISR